MFSTSTAYQTEESATQAILKYYIAMMRTDAAIDFDDGTHTDTNDDTETETWSIDLDSPQADVRTLIAYNTNYLCGTFDSHIRIKIKNIWHDLPFPSLATGDIGCSAEYDSNLYIGGPQGAGGDEIYIYYWDNGEWVLSTTIDTGAVEPEPEMMHVFNNELYLGTTKTKIIHKYDGTDWTEATDLTAENANMVKGADVFNNKLYFGSGFEGGDGTAKVWEYDGVTTWTVSTDTGSQSRIEAVLAYDGTLYATGLTIGTIEFDGTDWTDTTPLGFYCLHEFNNKMYCGDGAAGIVYEYDGSSFAISTNTSEADIFSLYDYKGDLYAGSSTGGKVFMLDVVSKLTLDAHKATGNWESTPFDSSHLTANVIYDRIKWTETLNGGTVTVQLKSASTSGGLGAASYTAYTNETIDHTERSRWYQIKVSLESHDLQADDFVVHTATGQVQIYCLLEYNSELFAGTGNTGVILKYDGATWAESTDTGDEYIFSLGIYGTNLYAGSQDGGIIFKYDGTDWTESTDTGIASIKSLYEYDSKLYAGSGNTGIIFKYDGVDPWTESTDTGDEYILCLMEYNSELYGGSSDGGIIYKYDGVSWTIDTDTSLAAINTFCVYNDELYAGTSSTGIILILDGTVWTESTDTGDEEIMALIEYDSNLYAGSGNDGIIYEYDGTTWTELTNTGEGYIQALCNYESVLFCGCNSANILRGLPDSPEVSNMEVRHKALIPKSEYVDLGTINYGVNKDNLQNMIAGNVTIKVENKDGQFEEHDTNAYIYGLNYYNKLLEIWVGFELADTTDEFLLQYLGEIENIKTDVYDQTALIFTRDYIYNKLNQIIGKPNSNGDPEPYMSGKRYRVPCKEVNATTFVYQFYCKGAITSIDSVYVRSTVRQKWGTPGANSTSVALKQVDFDADPAAEVAVDITVNTVEHPADIIKAILEDELDFDTDMYNSADFTIAKAVDSSLKVGCSFDSIRAIDAIKLLLTAMDGMIYVEDGKLRIKAFTTSYGAATQTLTESVHMYDAMDKYVTAIENKMIVHYDDYEDDKTKAASYMGLTSTYNHGQQHKRNLHFTYNDPVSIHTDNYSHFEDQFKNMLLRKHEEPEVYDLGVHMEILRTQTWDTIAVTSTKHNVTTKSLKVVEQSIRLTDEPPSGNIIAIDYNGMS